MDHPETFDEVIARGFQREPSMRHDRARPAAPAAPEPLAPPLAPANTVVTRSNASHLPTELQTAFKNAVSKLVQDGTYLQLIRHHMDMRHNMHGTMGEIGLYRFLAWHRRYLVEFERNLARVDRTLRPTATQPTGVPYWRWQDPFPAWLNGFLPAADPSGGGTPPARKNAAPPAKANNNDIDVIVNHFQTQRTGLPGENDYVRFTYGLEGWGRRLDGSPLPGHNQGHAWVGGIMNNTSTSPTDPVFWLHHAEVDRLWTIWRKTDPTSAPPLDGHNRVMDPWAESYDDLLDGSKLGYSYDSLSL
jgi:tyrosinase